MGRLCRSVATTKEEEEHCSTMANVANTIAAKEEEYRSFAAKEEVRHHINTKRSASLVKGDKERLSSATKEEEHRYGATNRRCASKDSEKEHHSATLSLADAAPSPAARRLLPPPQAGL